MFYTIFRLSDQVSLLIADIMYAVVDPRQSQLTVVRMIDKDKINENTEPNQLPEDTNEPMALDDARRIKVLSPGMLVSKRFIRNKLAVIGLVIITFMFPLHLPARFSRRIRRRRYSWAVRCQGLRGSDLQHRTALHCCGRPDFGRERAHRSRWAKTANLHFRRGLRLHTRRKTSNTYRILRLNPIAEDFAGLFSLTADPLSGLVGATRRPSEEKKHRLNLMDG